MHTGDRLVVSGSAPPGQVAPEKLISLAHVRAPQVYKAQNNKNLQEEAFGFDAREHLRSLCIGSNVTFRVLETQKNREVAHVFLSHSGTNLALSVLLAGFARAAETAPSEYKKAERSACDAGVGLWSASAPAFRLPSGDDLNTSDLLPQHTSASSAVTREQLQPHLYSVLVEHFLTATVVRVRLLDSLHTLNVPLAGVQAPRQPSTQSDGELFGREAKNFAELLALHRNASMQLMRKSSQQAGECFCRLWIWHKTNPNDDACDGYVDLAQSLLAAGLAQYVSSSGSLLEGTENLKLQQAESYAQQQQRGVWYNTTPLGRGANANSDGLHGDKGDPVKQSIEGSVIDIHAGDSFTLEDTSHSLRRFHLASVRSPKPGNPRRGMQPEPYASEALEWARQRLIGQRVVATVEYVRTLDSEDSKEKRTVEHVSLRVPDCMDDFGRELIRAGYATAIKHKKSDERAANYEELLQVEDEAKKKRVGLHSGKEPPPNRVNDLTSVKRARAMEFLPFLQRAGQTKCIVQAVISGHKLRLHIPSQSVDINLCLAAARTPAVDEARRFTLRQCNQRSGMVEVESVDKAGNFLGALECNGKDLVKELLSQGYAFIPRALPIEKLRNGSKLAELEEEARKNERGLWAYPNAMESNQGTGEESTAEESSDAASQPSAEGIYIHVTHVDSAGHFWAQKAADAHRVQSIQQQLQSCAATAVGDVANLSNDGKNWRPGSLCIARFESGDGLWYRAKVLHNSVKSYGADGRIVVRYCDFGNEESLGPESIRVLPRSLSTVPELAQHCALSYLRVPSLDDDCGDEALNELYSLVAGAQMYAFTDYRHVPTTRSQKGAMPPIVYMTLYPNAESSQSVNHHLACAGLAFVDSNAPDELKAAQEEALKQRRGLFQYGDPRGEEKL